MAGELESALEALVRREPRCAPFIAKLRATEDPSRVLDVLTDRPRERMFRAPISGVVDAHQALVGVWRGSDREWPRPPENPLGDLVLHRTRFDAIGWVLSRPVSLRVPRGQRVESGDDLAIVWCTLDERIEVVGDADVKVCVGDELPELAPQESHLVATALLQFFDRYPDPDASAAKTGGELVLASEFERSVERALAAGAAPPVARARVIGVTAR
ncbi:MAG: hypothetical protein JNJ54_26885 [Myxococcaceae bacterium]|nr:hypothetical protein [Myxococcaceae bacterium]